MWSFVKKDILFPYIVKIDKMKSESTRKQFTVGHVSVLASKIVWCSFCKDCENSFFR